MHSDDDQNADGTTCRANRQTASPARSDVLSQFIRTGKDAFTERFGVRLLTSYGMTETIVGIIGDRPGDKRRWPSIGRVGFSYEAEIRDDHNRPLPAGEIGEICIKGVPGKTIFKEYYAQPEATAKALEPEGWLHTGDSGYQDADGYFISSTDAAT